MIFIKFTSFSFFIFDILFSAKNMAGDLCPGLLLPDRTSVHGGPSRVGVTSLPYAYTAPTIKSVFQRQRNSEVMNQVTQLTSQQ